MRRLGNNATTDELTQALKELQRAVEEIRTGGGPAISRDMDMNGFRITNLGAPKAARDAQTRTTSVAGDDGIPSDSASYVLINPSGGLDNHRVLTAGSGITITEGGATGDVTISATGGTVTSVEAIPTSSFDGSTVLFANALTYVPDLSRGAVALIQEGVGLLTRVETSPQPNGEYRLEGTLRTIRFGRAPVVGDRFTAIYPRTATPTGVVTYPTYHSPAVGLSSSLGATAELGATITPTLTATWYQGDAGAATAMRLKLDGSTIDSGTVVGDINGLRSVTLAAVAQVFTAEVDYGTGAQLYDSTGAPYGTPIAAGTGVSGNVSFTGVRAGFYAADTTTAVATTSAHIRALANTFLAPATGNSFTISIPANTRRVTIAYPASVANITSIKYVELFNFDVVGTFSKTTISVNDASGGNATNYSVFTYIAAREFGTAVHYLVTL